MKSMKKLVVCLVACAMVLSGMAIATPVKAEGEDVTGKNVTFSTDEGVDSVDVYYTQNYSEVSENDVTSTVARNGDSGQIVENPDSENNTAQVNFKINLKKGYVIDSVKVTPKKSDDGTATYKNIKDPFETGKDYVWRITKIVADITVNITTKSIESFADAEKFTGSFEKDAGVASIDVYDTQDYSSTSETDVKSTQAKNYLSGLAQGDGDDQINFKVNFKDGYMVDKITVTSTDAGDATGAYANIKAPVDTEKANVWRITKITKDITIAVTSKLISSVEEDTTGAFVGTFKKDAGVDSIDLYYTQDYFSISKKRADSAVARNDVTGAPVIIANETDEKGQINFKVNVKDGYEVDEVTVSPEGSYKKIKNIGEDNEALKGIYRITQVGGNITITISTKAKTNETEQDGAGNGSGNQSGAGSGTTDSGNQSGTGSTGDSGSQSGTETANNAGNQGGTSVSSDSPSGASSGTDDTTKSTVTVKKVTLSSVKNTSKKSLKIKWKAVSGAKGYQLQYGLNKKITKGKKSKTVKSTSCTIKKLKKTTYYVRVRAYKLSGGKKIYGKWSAVKKAKVKK